MIFLLLRSSILAAPPNYSFNPTGISVPLIENLPVAQLIPGGFIRALGASTH
jgi:hypothetical protein